MIDGRFKSNFESAFFVLSGKSFSPVLSEAVRKAAASRMSDSLQIISGYQKKLAE